MPEIRFGLYGIFLADGPALGLYNLLDVTQRRIDEETGGQVVLQYPGPPSRSGRLHQKVRSPAEVRRSHEDAREFARRVASVGEPYRLSDLSEQLRQALGVPIQDLPAIVFFLPAASGESDRVTVSIPPRLLTGVYTQRDLANLLCRWLGPDSIRKRCPRFPRPGSAEDVEHLREHLSGLGRSLSALAGRSEIEPQGARGDLTARWLVYTDPRPRWISEEEYGDLCRARESYRVFLDEREQGVWHDGHRVDSPMPASYFRVLRACAVAKFAFDAGAFEEGDQEDWKQTFQRARKLVDVQLPAGRSTQWALFKTVHSRPALYRFDPSPGFKFALLFEDEDLGPPR